MILKFKKISTAAPVWHFSINIYLQNAVPVILSIFYSLPLFITLTNSFMNEAEITRNYSAEQPIFHLIPEIVTFEQYNEILIKTPAFLQAFWNSVAIALPVVIGQLLFASMAAYAFHVLRFKGKEVIYFIYIVVMLLPLQVTLMPNYIVADALNITDSSLAVILPGVFSPFGVFLIRQYLHSFPRAYLEAAAIDGADYFYVFKDIVLPNIKPALAATAILTFVDYWNLIDQAVIFIQEKDSQPLSLFIAHINEERMGVAFASSAFYVFPVVLIIIYYQDYLREGIQLSGIKG